MMKQLRAIVFCFLLATSLLTAANTDAMEAGRPGQPIQASQLIGKAYLVFIFYADHITFDYYDFHPDGDFSIWTIEEYGEGEYSVRDERLFRAHFEGVLSDPVEFTYRIKGLILSEKLIFGEGEEYLGNTSGVRYNFLGVISDPNATLDTTD